MSDVNDQASKKKVDLSLEELQALLKQVGEIAAEERDAEWEAAASRYWEETGLAEEEGREAGRGQVAGRPPPAAPEAAPSAGAGPRPQPDREPARAGNEADRVKPMRVYEGRLVGHGKAPYRNDPEAKPNYFVTLEADGREETVWGVGLKDAVADGGVQPDDWVSVQHLGSETVTVTEMVAGKDGRPVAREIQTERNIWSVEKAEPSPAATPRAEAAPLPKPESSAEAGAPDEKLPPDTASAMDRPSAGVPGAGDVPDDPDDTIADRLASASLLADEIGITEQVERLAARGFGPDTTAWVMAERLKQIGDAAETAGEDRKLALLDFIRDVEMFLDIPERAEAREEWRGFNRGLAEEAIAADAAGPVPAREASPREVAVWLGLYQARDKTRPAPRPEPAPRVEPDVPGQGAVHPAEPPSRPEAAAAPEAPDEAPRKAAAPVEETQPQPDAAAELRREEEAGWRAFEDRVRKTGPDLLQKSQATLRDMLERVERWKKEGSPREALEQRLKAHAGFERLRMLHTLARLHEERERHHTDLVTRLGPSMGEKEAQDHARMADLHMQAAARMSGAGGAPSPEAETRRAALVAEVVTLAEAWRRGEPAKLKVAEGLAQLGEEARGEALAFGSADPSGQAEPGFATFTGTLAPLAFQTMARTAAAPAAPFGLDARSLEEVSGRRLGRTVPVATLQATLQATFHPLRYVIPGLQPGNPGAIEALKKMPPTAAGPAPAGPASPAPPPAPATLPGDATAPASGTTPAPAVAGGTPAAAGMPAPAPAGTPEAAGATAALKGMPPSAAGSAPAGSASPAPPPAPAAVPGDAAAPASGTTPVPAAAGGTAAVDAVPVPVPVPAPAETPETMNTTGHGGSVDAPVAAPPRTMTSRLPSTNAEQRKVAMETSKVKGGARVEINGVVVRVKEFEKLTSVTIAAAEEDGFTRYNNVSVFGSAAKKAAELKEGDPIFVKGRVNEKSFEKPDGTRSWRVDIAVNQIDRGQPGPQFASATVEGALVRLRDMEGMTSATIVSHDLNDVPRYNTLTVL